MSEELAQDEEDAQDFDPEALELRSSRHRNHNDDDDDATLVGGHRGGASSVNEDAVVFEIGDEDAQDLSDEEDDPAKQRSARRVPAPHREHDDDGRADEREGLMGVKDRDE